MYKYVDIMPQMCYYLVAKRFARGYEAYQNRINRGYEAYQNRINRGYEAYQNRKKRVTIPSFSFEGKKKDVKMGKHTRRIFKLFKR